MGVPVPATSIGVHTHGCPTGDGALLLNSTVCYRYSSECCARTSTFPSGYPSNTLFACLFFRFIFFFPHFLPRRSMPWARICPPAPTTESTVRGWRRTPASTQFPAILGIHVCYDATRFVGFQSDATTRNLFDWRRPPSLEMLDRFTWWGPRPLPPSRTRS